MADLRVEGTVGRRLTALPANAMTDVWDGRTLDVEMYEGELTSLTEDEVLGDCRNQLFVGTGTDGKGEIIQFVNATLIGPRRYGLSKLLRGRRDTLDRMAGHAINDKEPCSTETSDTGALNSATTVTTSRSITRWSRSAVTCRRQRQ